MMLRGNLSTRPFYNERAVQFLLTSVGVALVALSLFTVWQLVSLTRADRELATRIAHDEQQAATLRAEAARIRGQLDARTLESTARATQEANTVIDARTFSWTALFNVIERTIPSDVRLRLVTPSVDRGVLTVQFVAIATRVESVAQFLDRLEAAGAFSNLRSVDEQALEDGTIEVTCAGQYLGPGAPDSEPETTTPARVSGQEAN